MDDPSHIRKALEVALNAMSPALDVAWENTVYTPTVGVAYQAVNLLRADPDNSEIGQNYIEIGFMQVALRYPQNAGPGAAEDRATLLRTTFKRGLSFNHGGVIVIVTRTPSILPAQNDGDRYVVPVRIRWRASLIG